jgi:hypothetical protein
MFVYLQNYKAKDSGTYTCNIKNEAGEANVELTLNIEGLCFSHLFALLLWRIGQVPSGHVARPDRFSCRLRTSLTHLSCRTRRRLARMSTNPRQRHNHASDLQFFLFLTPALLFCCRRRLRGFARSSRLRQTRCFVRASSTCTFTPCVSVSVRRRSFRGLVQ